MASNSDDIKFILRHFNMPHAIKAYLDSSSDFGSEFSPLSERDSTLHPLTSSGGNDFNTFFESMKSWSEGLFSIELMKIYQLMFWDLLFE